MMGMSPAPAEMSMRTSLWQGAPPPMRIFLTCAASVGGGAAGLGFAAPWGDLNAILVAVTVGATLGPAVGLLLGLLISRLMDLAEVIRPPVPPPLEVLRLGAILGVAE